MIVINQLTDIVLYFIIIYLKLTCSISHGLLVPIVDCLNMNKWMNEWILQLMNINEWVTVSYSLLPYFDILVPAQIPWNLQIYSVLLTLTRLSVTNLENGYPLPCSNYPRRQTPVPWHYSLHYFANVISTHI